MKLDRPYEIEGPLSEELVYRINANFEALFAFQLDLAEADNITDTVLGVENGGTGLDEFAIGDLLYASATDTLTRLAIGSAGKVLRSTGTVPDWSSFTIPNTFAQGDIPHASTVNVLTALAKGAEGTYIRAGAAVPAYSALLIADFPSGGTWDLNGTALTLSEAGLLFSTDNTHDIGAAGATRPRDLYLGRNADIDGTLDVAGVSTLRANLLFSADATHDIGAAGATRPRDVFLSRDLTIGDQIFERGRSVALGEWQTVSFSAGDFTANGAMTWTVASGDVSANRYTLIGKTMVWSLAVDNTTVGGTLDTTLRATIPGGFSAGSEQNYPAARASDNGTIDNTVFVTCRSGQAYVEIRKSALTNWASSTDATSVYFTIMIELQ